MVPAVREIVAKPTAPAAALLGGPHDLKDRSAPPYDRCGNKAWRQTSCNRKSRELMRKALEPCLPILAYDSGIGLDCRLTRGIGR